MPAKNDKPKEAKSVLITGCSSGIGLALAKGLKKRGYRVFATTRKDEDVIQLKDQGFESFKLDLAYSGSIRGALSSIMQYSNGKLYGLINNGAYGQPGAVEDLRREALVKQFETNVFGTQELTNQVLPIMREANEGRVVQISSILGLVCLPFRGAYNASKYALEALTDTMRLELADTNIKLSLIEPGPISSDFRKNALQAFETHIDGEKSVHRELYKAVLTRLGNTKDPKFTLPPEAVLKKTIHALESPRPKVRYLVTTPAHGLARLKRIMPDRLMDRILGRSMGS